MTAYPELVAKVRQAIEAAQLSWCVEAAAHADAVAEAAIAAVAKFIQEGS